MNKYENTFIQKSLAKCNWYSILLLCVFVTTSCKHTQKITLSPTKCLLEPRNPHNLTFHLNKNEFKFDKLNARLSVDASIDSSSFSFTVVYRAKHDSLLWMSISKLGVEGARLLISKDSVKFINRLSNKYFVGDYAYLSKLLNTELDFELLQSILIGNSVSFYDDDEKLKSGMDNCMYTLGTIRKFKLRKITLRGKDLKEPAQIIYLNADNFKISQILFYEFNPDRNFEAAFSDYRVSDSMQLFPYNLHYKINARKKIKIDAVYTKAVMNEDQSFPFKIPNDYEPIEYNEK